MASQLNELDSDALLVMYLAGELTNGDKAAVERRLANEPELAAELARLREVQGFCFSAIKTGDEHARMPVGEGVAIRRVSRAMVQWMLDHRRAAPAGKKKGLPLPWWSYPAAAAAAIIIGFLVWSSRQPLAGGYKDDSVVQHTPDSEPTDEQQVASVDIGDWIDSSFRAPLEASAAGTPDELSGSPAGIEDIGSSMFPTPQETIQ